MISTEGEQEENNLSQFLIPPNIDLLRELTNKGITNQEETGISENRAKKVLFNELKRMVIEEFNINVSPQDYNELINFLFPEQQAEQSIAI